MINPEFQLELDIPMEFILPAYAFASVPIARATISSGGIMIRNEGSKDHPTFAELRTTLALYKMIDRQDMWLNGDRVLIPFYLNGLLLEEGETFYCATAWYHRFNDEQRNSWKRIQSISTLTEYLPTLIDTTSNCLDQNQLTMNL